ncbi:HNH endonuclease [Burkholderia ambifaria]|uniref:HNH endonuclease n=1 Tax=Burkholderia ambifaria TaxID=152480 RepID=UPI003CCA44A0
MRAAHIHRWADFIDDTRARTDLENGLLLTANLDALFESGLVTFDDDGIIVISRRLDSTMRDKLAIHTDMRLRRPPSVKQCVYLQKHRTRTAAVREGRRM